MQVTSVPSISAAVNSSTTTPASASALNVSADQFLQMLIAELKNQDPSNPVDSTQYLSQLATLSGLQQSVQQTTALQGLSSISSQALAGSVIGLRATSADGTVTGIVTATQTNAGGVMATLDSGATLSLSSGVTLSKS